MTNAFKAVAGLARGKKCYARDASYFIFILRVAKVIEGRVWVKSKK